MRTCDFYINKTEVNVASNIGHTIRRIYIGDGCLEVECIGDGGRDILVYYIEALNTTQKNRFNKFYKKAECGLLKSGKVLVEWDSGYDIVSIRVSRCFVLVNCLVGNKFKRYVYFSKTQNCCFGLREKVYNKV